MEASILSGKGVVEVEASEDSTASARWEHFLENLKGFFESEFESDWEEKTGLPWREWHKWG